MIYTKTMVRFYDVIYGKLLDSAMKDFYVNEILKAKGPSLEIGTGTGQIFCPALKAGADVYGIDPSKTMQDYLKQKIQSNEYHRLKLVDVRDFDFGKKFKLIIAPFRIFSHLLTINDQLSALENIKNHLEPGGRFIFDVFLPDLEGIRVGKENSLDYDGEYEPGKSLKRFDTGKPDYLNQFQHVTFKFVWDEDNEVHEETIEFPFRYYFRYELEHLIARAGLKLDKMYGNFKYGEINSSSKNIVCVCSKN